MKEHLQHTHWQTHMQRSAVCWWFPMFCTADCCIPTIVSLSSFSSAERQNLAVDLALWGAYFVQINDAISILTRQKKVMNRDKRCENPHLWYCSCWGFCCSVPCSFEKLHRHKLKTIFNFKITEWVVKWSSSHGGSPVFWFLSQPFLSNLLPKKKKRKRKCPKRSVWTQCVFGVFFCFVLFLF